MASFARIGEEQAAASGPVPWQELDWAERLEKAIERGANHLLSLQAEQGYWQGELEADSTLESDYIYYLHVLVGGRFSLCAEPGTRAGNGASPWRAGAFQFLRSVLFGAGRRGELGSCSFDSSRADAYPPLVHFQYLRNVVVDARYRRPHGDSVGPASRLATTRARPRR